MTANESPAVGDVFELLNRWRHLPFYSLETRAAPFFAIFLPDVLSEALDVEMHQTVIPEFPLRIGTLKHNDSNLSYNVDYVAFAKDKSKAYLVELKTDMGSKRGEQDKYLCKARDIEFGCLVKGVRELAKVRRPSNKRRKYFHLLHLLFAPGSSLLTTPGSPHLDEHQFRKGMTRWPSSVDQLEIDPTSFKKTRVVFIQPKADPKRTNDTKKKYDFNYIYFDQVADIVQRHGNLGCIFANFLRQWVEEAGSPNPNCIHRS